MRESEFTPTPRKHTPSVIQMEATECGAAALGMVLGYHGRFVSLETLRLECGVSRNGSNALNLLKAARKHGLDAEGLRKDIDELAELPLPVILFWAFDHFVVLEGFTRRYAWINDPAIGRRKVAREEFDTAYTGVVLSFQPGPEFKKSGTRPGIWRPLRERLRGGERAIGYAVLAGLLLVIPGLAVPAVTRVFVDDVLVHQRHDWLLPVLLILALVALVQGALTWLQRVHLLRLQMFLSVRGSSRFVRHVLRLCASFFDERYPGDLANRVQMNDTVAQMLSGQLTVTLISIATLVFYAALMFRYNVALALIAIAFGLLDLIALRAVSCHRIDLNHQVRQEQSKLMGVSMSGLQMIESLKAGGLEADFLTKWTGYQARLVAAEQQLTLSTQLVTLLPSFLSLTALTVVLFVGGTEIIAGTMTVGTLAAFNALLACFMTPLDEIVGMGRMLQDAHASIDRLDDVMHQPDASRNWAPEAADADPATGRAKIRGQLIVRNISFGYSPLEEPFLRDFNLTVEPGCRIAIVGRTGSGKSTTARLCAGLYTPSEGSILLDGRPIGEIPATQLASSLAMVDQNVFLFSGTVKDNLTLWDERIGEADVVQGAKDACIHDEIAKRPGGYEAEVREGGLNFSGGERQRLEIARALSIQPSLIILDEATSALDPPTEKQIDDNLRRRSCSCLIIAHRLSTVRDCDEIIVLDGGRVVQRGKHEDLEKQEGLYAELIRDQW